MLAIVHIRKYSKPDKSNTHNKLRNRNQHIPFTFNTIFIQRRYSTVSVQIQSDKIIKKEESSNTKTEKESSKM